MAKNLETADAIVKVVMSISILVSYYAGIFKGPFAKLLVLLALIVIVLAIVKFVSRTRDP